MNRTVFLILSLILLCALPVIGALHGPDATRTVRLSPPAAVTTEAPETYLR